VDEGATEEMPTRPHDPNPPADKGDPASKPASKRSGDAAANILRKLMERRKASN
jgi:hypothetical protein